MAGVLHLKVVTPDSMVYEGDVSSLVVRTVEGEVCILPRHIDYMAALGTGEARITAGNAVLKAQCSGGMLSVSGGDRITLLSSKFEWKN